MNLHASSGQSRARFLVTAGLAGTLVFSGAFVNQAFADSKTDLVSAQTQLEQIGRRYTELRESLQKAGSELETTKGEIDKTSQKLVKAQAQLSDSVSLDYKTGNAKLSAVVLGSTNFNDLISRITYMNKLSRAQTEAINDVKDLKAQLEDKQDEQQKRLENTQSQVDETAANQRQAQKLVDSLSADVKAQLKAKAADNTAIAAGLQSSEDAKNAPAGGNIMGGQTVDEAVKPQAPSQSINGNTESKPNVDSSTDATPTPTPEPTPEPAPSTPPSNNTTTLPSNPTGGSPLAIALQYAGTPYIYGSASPANGGFDCSGLVQFAYAQCGISLPRTDSEQRAYIQNNGFFTTDVNQLSYGDLVFFPGHVAFYMGNGQIYGAQAPGSPTGTSNMIYFGAFLGGGHL